MKQATTAPNSHAKHLQNETATSALHQHLLLALLQALVIKARRNLVSVVHNHPTACLVKESA